MFFSSLWPYQTIVPFWASLPSFFSALDRGRRRPPHAVTAQTGPLSFCMWQAACILNDNGRGGAALALRGWVRGGAIRELRPLAGGQLCPLQGHKLQTKGICRRYPHGQRTWDPNSGRSVKFTDSWSPYLQISEIVLQPRSNLYCCC